MMYKAPPEFGTFEPDLSFDLVPQEQHDRERYQANATKLPLRCRRLLCSADINVYGDARFVREFRGVRALEEPVHDLPALFAAEAKSGLVEAYVARSLSNHGPAVSARPTRINAHRVEAKISFTRRSARP